MATPPEMAKEAWKPDPRAIHAAQPDVAGLLAEFESAVAAYDALVPETEVRMLAAFHRFLPLGYEAYFRGEVDGSPQILAHPFCSTMWKLGFDVAESDAVNRRCNCACDKRYARGKGYGTCPCIPQTVHRR